jgi:HPt (histidine-containing phosphotransfer) domain-containing protein
MQDARNRLCNDPALFRTLLQRLLADFSDLGVRSSQREPAGLVEQANRLHKLKGGASILGAKAIQHLAAEAEAACAAGDAAGARERTIELVNQLDALRSSAARAFEDRQESLLPR